MSSKVVIFVDGGFLSKLSKYFGGGEYLKFDYISFFNNLATESDLKLEKVFYYTAPPFLPTNPNKSEIVRKRGYDKFVSKLKRKDVIEIKEGRIQKLVNSRNEVEFHQKGVDVLMSLDMAFVAEEFGDVEVFLITSDTDFCPVIKRLLSKGIQITLWTYKETKKRSDFILSQHLISCCNKVKYLSKEDMEKFKLK